MHSFYTDLCVSMVTDNKNKTLCVVCSALMRYTTPFADRGRTILHMGGFVWYVTIETHSSSEELYTRNGIFLKQN